MREFTELAFKEAGIPIRWEGSGESEVGVCTTTGNTLVEIDPRYYRPAEVDTLVGDATKAETVLGWKAQINWEELCKEMTQADLKSAK